jgi:hypothetical protein
MPQAVTDDYDTFLAPLAGGGNYFGALLPAGAVDAGALVAGVLAAGVFVAEADGFFGFAGGVLLASDGALFAAAGTLFEAAGVVTAGLLFPAGGVIGWLTGAVIAPIASALRTLPEMTL